MNPESLNQSLKGVQLPKTLRLIGCFILAGLLFGTIGWGIALGQGGKGTFIRLTTASEGNRDSLNPAINDDGSKIIFISDSDFFNQGISDDQYDIWLFSTPTMTLTRITTNSGITPPLSHINPLPAKPTISGDGTKIFFTSTADFLNEGTTKYRIWLYNISTATLTQVVSIADLPPPSHSDCKLMDPAISNDGTKLLFIRSCYAGSALYDHDIWLLDTNAMTQTHVLNAKSFSQVECTLNSDGSKFIIYYGSRPRLYDSATLSYSFFVRDVQYLPPGPPDINGDGTKIAYSNHISNSSSSRHEVWLYNTKTITYTRITTTTDTSDRASSNPILSAVGNDLVFMSDADLLNHNNIVNDQFEIWLARITPTFLTRLTIASDSNRDSLNAAMSADGMTVVFESDSDLLGQGIPDDQREIWLYQVDPLDSSPSWTYLPIVMK